MMRVSIVGPTTNEKQSEGYGAECEYFDLLIYIYYNFKQCNRIWSNLEEIKNNLAFTVIYCL